MSTSAEFRTRKWGGGILPKIGIIAVLSVALLLMTAGLAFAADAWVASDKADYAPGETVTLTGGGWLPGSTVSVVTNDVLGSTDPWWDKVTVTATDGTF